MGESELSMRAAGVSRMKAAMLRKYLVPGRCLDMGCGSGLYGVICQERGVEVLQGDLEDRRLPAAKHLSFEVMDANAFELGDRGFENILAFDLIEHLDDAAAFLRMMHRHGRKRLFVSVPNEEDAQPRMMRLTHEHHLDKTHKRLYTREGLAAVLEQTGWCPITIHPMYNTCLFDFPYAVASGRRGAKLAARLVSLQLRVLRKVGLFENRCVGDWIAVAERVEG